MNREMKVLLVTVIVSLAVPLSSPAGIFRSDLDVASPSTRVQALEESWLSHLRSGAAAAPGEKFANLAATELRRRVGLMSRRYGFQTLRIEIHHPRQAAPLVVIEARDRSALAAATPAILKFIDPKAPTGDDRTGWAFEGFFFEVRDQKGVPFIAVFNWWRGPHAGGGQWASRPNLLPFAHG